MSEQTTVRVPLTVEDRAGKADAMARLVKRIEGVKAQAKEAAAEFREEIEGLMAELDAIADIVQEGAEQRAQLDLTFTQVEAAKALAAVGSAAGECSCEGGPEAEVKSPACPVHGVETRGENPAPCDGVHGQEVACADPKCWLIEGPAEEPIGTPAVSAEPAPEVAADNLVPEAEHVDVGTVEEPAAVADFHEAKRKRRARG